MPSRGFTKFHAKQCETCETWWKYSSFTRGCCESVIYVSVTLVKAVFIYDLKNHFRTSWRWYVIAKLKYAIANFKYAAAYFKNASTFGGKRLGVLVQTPKRFIFSFFPLHFRAKCTTLTRKCRRAAWCVPASPPRRLRSLPAKPSPQCICARLRPARRWAHRRERILWNG